MGLAGILRYTATALAFAAAAAGAFLAIRRGRLRPGDGRRLLLAAYLAALVEITALRLGLRAPRWLGGSLRLAPLLTTLEEARGGPWRLIYHVVGNMAWFMPLGMLLPGGKRRCLAAGAGLSVAIEAVQFLLGTGVSDVDDVLFNALGALAGLALRRAASQIFPGRGIDKGPN